MRKAVIVTFFVLFAACKQQVVVQTNPTSSPGPSVAAATAAPAQSGAPSSSDALAEGRSFGYIKAVNYSARTLSFDLAYFYTGEAAQRAAREDGQANEGDYYIRNKNTKLRTVSLSGDVQIMIVNWPNCCDSISGDLDKFSLAFNGGADDLYHGPTSPYWLTVHDGAVTLIEEQFLP